MKLQSLLEVKSGFFNSPMIGQKVKILTSDGGSFGKGDHQGKIGTVTHAERVHTFSQMVPFKIEYRIELDDGDAVFYRREAVKKVQNVSEASSLQFFVDQHGKVFLVMNSRGDIHDAYDTKEEAQDVADDLNIKYGK